MNDIAAPLPKRSERRRQRKKMRTGRKALIAVLILILALGVLLGAVFLGAHHFVNSQIQHVEVALLNSDDTAGAPQRPAATQTSGAGTTFLILGSDSRQSGGDPANWQAGAGRSDVLMLVQIEQGGTGINIMSIPRDSWVEIPGVGQAKINAAYSYGGADLTIQTVENLLGVRVDHFMVTDFTSFAELTDALGGVSIAQGDGVQTFNGSEALTYVRERYSLPRGDFDRVQRQQAWMRAIAQKTFSRQVLQDPSKLVDMVSIITRYSALDQNLNFDTCSASPLSWEVCALTASCSSPSRTWALAPPTTGNPSSS